ncbi:uroporphyrinogen-III synthase HemD [Colletotrichum graminicola]|uniref:Uroporphyrinogen-III synthase HemD n=1 Tax=Colletotrichum graminicola (strain M1.001 / M2 / FGSC 10212) TaxID=645133 RepID=E3QLS6_COLGM|nr:uroporphyrinogen-III synthase HemD [Colletotrichum graminicola M1.001]EFQ31814.1 uroporphyrinogen-III synthase HemD [Colletotrichum graminicola M1.001]WDK13579.1 uroporphyrinogen-III synthase HemD [Colletotrichum graminicola]
MAEIPSSSSLAKVPVLLLKTRSLPGDAYEDLFSRKDSSWDFEPTFVPVLHHSFQEQGMATVRDILHRRGINTSTDASYGGLVFTSQRAVEAFSSLVAERKKKKKGEEEEETDEKWPHLQDVPVYSVGPATTRALNSISQQPPLKIFGEHTGNGDALAKFILEHYGRWYQDRPTKPPVLFLVGEQRRDIIPKRLMDVDLPSDRRIQVDEVVVYGTGVMKSFPRDFAEILKTTEDRPARWVVVFSPTGCDSMLRGLGLMDESTGKAKRDEGEERKTFIATIGPTTRDYLRRTFDFEPDVCAEEPTPKGVESGIMKFLERDKRDSRRSQKPLENEST